MAPDTTAKLKIVFAKSYRAHAAGTMARPLGVRAARPRALGRWADGRGGAGHGRMIRVARPATMPAMERHATPHDLARDLRLAGVRQDPPHDDRRRARRTGVARARASSRAVGDGRATLWFDGERLDEHDPRSGGTRPRPPAVRCHEARSSRLPHQADRRPKASATRSAVHEYPTIGSADHEDVHRRTRSRRAELQIRREARGRTRGADLRATTTSSTSSSSTCSGSTASGCSTSRCSSASASSNRSCRAEQLVRPSPFVREPLGSWIGSWRAQGFRGMTFKAANSRYRPGETADDWTLADLPHR